VIIIIIKAASSDERVLVPASQVGVPAGRERMPAVRAFYRLSRDTDLTLLVGGALPLNKKRLVDILRP